MVRLLYFLLFTTALTRADEASYTEILRAWEGPEKEATHEGIRGRVLTGYQGWFRCEGDGAGMGWNHYDIGVKGKGSRFEPGACSIDLWPDLSEYGKDERFATPFRHADGSVAEVFSSQHPETVKRHFQWMADYGIDGAFVQRFAVVARDRRPTNSLLAADNRKLMHCREAANASGTCWALMYDLSGIRDKDMPAVIRDWTMLRKHFDLGNDPSYLRHEGKPLVAIWGGGFKGEDRPSIPKVLELARLIKDNPDWGGCSLMLGVPTGWRERERDCLQAPEKELGELFGMADILSPWTIGRYRNLEEVEIHADRYWEPDRKAVEERGGEYLPVVFPGFSWHNHSHREEPLDQMPRLGGKFLWKQFLEAKGAGAEAVYVAMFDEMDEGTAIFKCTNDPPVGKSPFLTYKGLPSDHYLHLCGEARKLFREELPLR